MQTDFNDIQNLWKQEKDNIGTNSNAASIIRLAEHKRKKTTRTQLANITVLVFVVLVLISYFVFVARFQQILSKTGEVLMIGSLLIRIFIETGSIFYSKHIDFSETALKNNDTFLRYFRFRKKIHGPVTVAILIIYTIGFYMLTPEFISWFPMWLLILIDVSYIVAALIFSYFIRSAIKREMKALHQIHQFREDLLAQ